MVLDNLSTFCSEQTNCRQKSLGKSINYEIKQWKLNNTYILCNVFSMKKIAYLSGVMTHRYLSHPIAMIANEERKIGIC